MEVSKRKERVIACALVAFSVIYLLGCLDTAVGRMGNPGAGMIPRLIAACLLIFTGLNAFRAFRRDYGASAPHHEARGGYRSAAIGIAIVILLYPLFLYTLKAVAATFVSSFVMLRLMRYKTVVQCIVVSMGVSASVYVIFALMLKVTFPSGPIERFLWRLL
jgi:hypothetical protein